MFGLKSLKLSLLLTWMLSSTGETQSFSAVTVTVGDDVTLTCLDYKEFNDKCYSTTWLYSDSQKIVPLWEYGKVHREAGSKSYRRTITAECFLVIKKVRVEDAGLYVCRQFDSSGHHVTDSMVELSVIEETKPGRTSSTITRFPTTTTTTTTTTPQTSVTTTSAVKTEPNPEETKPGKTSSTITLFPTTTTTTTTTTTPQTSVTTTSAVKTEPNPEETKPGKTSSTITLFPTTTTTTTTTPQTSVPTTSETKTEPNPDLLPLRIGAAVGLAALLITTVMIIRWRKTKGSKTQMDDKTTVFIQELSLNSAGTRSGPETSQDTVDPVDEVHIYASIYDTNTSNTGAQVHREDGAIYSVIEAPAAASTDPDNLYSTIQEYR